MALAETPPEPAIAGGDPLAGPAASADPAPAVVATMGPLGLVALLTGAALTTIDSFIVNVALPRIDADLHTSSGELTLIIAGYAIAYALLLVVGGPDQRASLWWPADRSWCVATDVDAMTTYIGASQSCVDALTADNQLEAMPVPYNQRLGWDTDAINPAPTP